MGRLLAKLATARARSRFLSWNDKSGWDGCSAVTALEDSGPPPNSDDVLGELSVRRYPGRCSTPVQRVVGRETSHRGVRIALSCGLCAKRAGEWLAWVLLGRSIMTNRIEKWLSRSALVVVFASVGCSSRGDALEQIEIAAASEDLPTRFTAPASAATREATGIEVWQIETVRDADMRIAGLNVNRELVVAWQARNLDGKHHYELRTATTSASLAVALDGNGDDGEERVIFFENSFRGNEEAIDMLRFLRVDMASVRMEPSGQELSTRMHGSSLLPQSPAPDLIDDPDSRTLVDPQCESLVREQCSDAWDRYVSANSIADYECIDCNYPDVIMPVICSDCSNALKLKDSSRESLTSCKKHTNWDCNHPDAPVIIAPFF